MFTLHLKKVVIQGFKSFPDKVQIEFKDGITGIVGPNGSGKSNVSDAIRWVLGEQSVKTLRGNTMEDIIFTGTDKRRPLGFAEVTLILDNKDGGLLIEYSEVSITRRMFRNGESEYYINKNSCRLKDIKELLMDTGIGKDGYSIIGQGRVDEILSAKSEDRRVIFEEAAGIVKYKNRKEESEVKLKKTEENLVRINDIISELEKQAIPLKEQSISAKEYLKLSNSLKELEVNYYIDEIDKLKYEIEEVNKIKLENQKELEFNTNEKENIKSQSLQLDKELKMLDSQIEELQSKRYENQSLIEKNDSNNVLYAERENYLKEEEERVKNQIDSLNTEKKELLNQREDIARNIQAVNNKLNVLNKKFSEMNSKMEDVDSEIKNKEIEIENKKDSVIGSFNEISERKSNINSCSVFKDNIEKRITQLEKENKKLNSVIQENKDKLAIMSDNIENKKLNLDSLKINKNRTLEEKNNIESKIQKITEEINGLREIYQGKLSNYKLLKNMKDDYEGYYKSVKNVIFSCKKDKSLGKGVRGVVAELISVDKKYERAIEVALGSSLQHIVVDTEFVAERIIDYLKKNNLGRVTFLPLSSIKGRKISYKLNDDEGVIGIASDLIKFNDEYKDIFNYLLGRVVIVKDLKCGIKLAKKCNYSFKIVTLDGDVINAGGSMTGGSYASNNVGFLGRDRQIHELNKDMISIKSNIEKSTQIYKKLNVHVESLKNKIDEFNEEINKINIEIIKDENVYNRLIENSSDNNSSINEYHNEIKELRKNMNDIEIQMKTTREELKEIEQKRTSDQDRLNSVIDYLNERKIYREQIAKKLTNIQVEKASLEKGLDSYKSEMKKIEIEYSDLLSKEEQYYNEQKSSKEELEKIDQLKEKLQNGKLKLEKSLCEHNNMLSQLKKDKEHKLAKSHEIQNKIESLDYKLNILEKKAMELDMKIEKSNMHLNNYLSKMLEDYNLKYDEAILLKKPINKTNLKKDIKGIRESINKLGNVNLMSIDEYEKVTKRLDFIKNQRNDLLHGKESLKVVINDLESKMEKQFVDQLEIIKINFNETFKELFGGGKASICLKDENDVLNCGIDIVAQPPGKKLQNLSLLSGGEKSLTAVALLFAILKTKPTPFCILDELDAALDEANVCRYARYLRKLSKDIQFIVITHRKNTMEVADVLYGITMEEEGISKIISVKLTDRFKEEAS